MEISDDVRDGAPRIGKLEEMTLTKLLCAWFNVPGRTRAPLKPVYNEVIAQNKKLGFASVDEETVDVPALPFWKSIDDHDELYVQYLTWPDTLRLPASTIKAHLVGDLWRPSADELFLVDVGGEQLLLIDERGAIYFWSHMRGGEGLGLKPLKHQIRFNAGARRSS